MYISIFHQSRCFPQEHRYEEHYTYELSLMLQKLYSLALYLSYGDPIPTIAILFCLFSLDLFPSFIGLVQAGPRAIYK
jgi:hypothetical protein